MRRWYPARSRKTCKVKGIIGTISGSPRRTKAEEMRGGRPRVRGDPKSKNHTVHIMNSILFSSKDEFRNSKNDSVVSTTQDNLEGIQDVLDSMRLSLIILAAVMLALAFLGFLFSIFGMQCLVYFLVILGWILVTGTFILCDGEPSKPKYFIH